MIGNINKWLDICGKSDWRGILLNGMASLQDTFPNCFCKQNLGRERQKYQDENKKESRIFFDLMASGSPPPPPCLLNVK